MNEYDTQERRVRMWAAAGTDARCECCGIVRCDTCWQTCEFNGACALSADFESELTLRMTSGYEVSIMKAGHGLIGAEYVGEWQVKLFRFGIPLFGMRNHLTLSPSNHLTAVRSAVHTLRCAGLISDEAQEA